MARTFRFGSNWKRDLGTFLEFPFFRDLGTHLIPFFYILVQLFYIIIHLFYILVHLFYILVHFFISSFIFLYPRSFFISSFIFFSASTYYLCQHPLTIYIHFHLLSMSASTYYLYPLSFFISTYIYLHRIYHCAIFSLEIFEILFFPIFRYSVITLFVTSQLFFISLINNNNK